MKVAAALALFLLPVLLLAKEVPDPDQSERIEKRLRFADELESQGDEEGALKILQELSKDDPKNGELLKRIAGLLMQNERFKEAIPPLRKMLELEEGTATEYAALARMMIEVNESEAVPFLEDAAKRFPESADFPFLLTFSLARLDRWEDAITQFEKTLALAKEDEAGLIDESFYFRYAAAHERAGHIDEAGKLFRKTLDLIKANDPDDENAPFTATVLNYFAYMLIEEGNDLDEAGKLALEAADLDPESGAIADTVGWFYFQKGNFPRALVELKKAERLIEAPDPVIFDHLGQTLAKLNEKSFAAEYFRKALELDPKNEALKTRLNEVAQ